MSKWLNKSNVHTRYASSVGEKVWNSQSCKRMSIKPQETDGLLASWGTLHSPAHSPPSSLLPSENALTHQWGHVSSVHLPRGDLLLRRGHTSHIVGVGATDRPRANYTWKRYWAVLHTTHPVELLLQNCGPYAGEKEIRRHAHTLAFVYSTYKHAVTADALYVTCDLPVRKWKTEDLNESMCIVERSRI